MPRPPAWAAGIAPGPSTDCSVTDGLRWIGTHNSVAALDQPKRGAMPSLIRAEPREPGRPDQSGVTTELGGHHAQAGQEFQPGVVDQRRAQRTEEQFAG